MNISIELIEKKEVRRIVSLFSGVVTDSCARFGPCLYDGYMEGTTLILWIRPVQSSIFFRSYWRRSSDLETIWFLLRTRRIKNLKSKSKCRIINADNYIFFPPLKNLRWWILQLLFSIRCVTRYPASKKKKIKHRRFFFANERTRKKKKRRGNWNQNISSCKFEKRGMEEKKIEKK